MPRKAPSFQPRRIEGAADTRSIERKRRERERDRKAAFDRHRPSAHMRGYDGRWRKYRITFLLEHPLCAHCLDKGDVTPATCVDHINRHNGDADLFWDPDNHQSLCDPCHSRKTATEDSDFARPKN